MRVRGWQLPVAGACALAMGLVPVGSAAASWGRAPATAPATPVPAPGGAAAVREAEALGLLSRAAVSAARQGYAGMEFVTTWHQGAEFQRVYEVSNSPGTGLVLADPTSIGAGQVTVPGGALDARLLRLLAAHYSLQVGRPEGLSGRMAWTVEVRRPANGSLAGRFWLDRDSGLVLRREVWDDRGRLVRSSGFANLSMSAAGGPVPVGPTAAGPTGERVDQVGLDTLRSEGWPVPTSLAGGLELFDARLWTHGRAGVLHLAYSDGLMTVSLFVQPGRLGSAPGPGFTRQSWGGHHVFVRAGEPARVLWSGGGRVWTLVSESPDPEVRAVVLGLPHDHPGLGLLARLRHGLARLAAWVNPFG